MEEYGGFGNGEFSEIANSILGEMYRESRLEEGLLSDEEIMGTKRIRTGVRSEQIPEIIRSATGMTEFNCYPGYPSNTCYQTAFFISLNSKLIARSSGHLHFRKIVERIKEHMLLKCERTTRNIIIITDSWDARIASNEQTYINKIKSQANVELYFFAVSPVFFVTRVPI
ncbi:MULTISPECIES: hypothetical protein [unclassified Mesotoga]|uniref:hypothetical protein n=1 Tax=unclassified Mesotoga TaxID=1184398 RepID=UPI000DA68C9C|nr:MULTISPECIES: hypothetical protein [unclassified Mesotoga]PZC51357.1 hypothetical protein LH53_11810 [Mesotoga sp. TolDC]PZC52333.1 hypothetical protein LH53_05345 [Mesotoga sp. TolDC]